MHPYVPHLIDDITAAERAQPSPTASEDDLEDILEQVMRIKESGHTFGYYCGLCAENFPPPGQLMGKDMFLVGKAFKKMMRSWNLKCSLPKGLPQHMVYTLLLKSLDRKIDPEFCGTVTFNYCSLNPARCLLEKYCTCRMEIKS